MSVCVCLMVCLSICDCLTQLIKWSPSFTGTHAHFIIYYWQHSGSFQLHFDFRLPVHKTCLFDVVVTLALCNNACPSRETPQRLHVGDG